jgi:hypothetical protein
VPAAGPVREATMTQQAVTGLVPEHRPGPVPVTIGPRPSPGQPAEPGGTARPSLRPQSARRPWT